MCMDIQAFQHNAAFKFELSQMIITTQKHSGTKMQIAVHEVYLKDKWKKDLASVTVIRQLFSSCFSWQDLCTCINFTCKFLERQSKLIDLSTCDHVFCLIVRFGISILSAFLPRLEEQKAKNLLWMTNQLPQLSTGSTIFWRKQTIRVGISPACLSEPEQNLSGISPRFYYEVQNQRQTWTIAWEGADFYLPLCQGVAFDQVQEALFVSNTTLYSAAWTN